MRVDHDGIASNISPRRMLTKLSGIHQKTSGLFPQTSEADCHNMGQRPGTIMHKYMGTVDEHNPAPPKSIGNPS